MLEQLKYKIEQKKPVSVVYLGGSITEGTGASSPAASCWASRVQNWLERVRFRNPVFPVREMQESAVRIPNSACFVWIGMCWPMSRIWCLWNSRSMTIKRRQPFCLNAMEGIVRRIRERRPGADVVFVVTAMYRMEEECYSRGIRPESVQDPWTGGETLWNPGGFCGRNPASPYPYARRGPHRSVCRIWYIPMIAANGRAITGRSQPFWNRH